MKSTVSERGQVTIPKELRDRLGLKPGVVLDFVEEQGRLVATKVLPDDPLEESFGLLQGALTSDETMARLRGLPDQVDP
jgi:AbrB family looped-hinge helix DNA binding protein